MHVKLRLSRLREPIWNRGALAPMVEPPQRLVTVPIISFVVGQQDPARVVELQKGCKREGRNRRWRIDDEWCYSNQAANGRDHFGTGNKFIVPTVANGKVYVGTTNGVGVFGLLH